MHYITKSSAIIPAQVVELPVSGPQEERRQTKIATKTKATLLIIIYLNYVYTISSHNIIMPLRTKDCLIEQLSSSQS